MTKQELIERIVTKGGAGLTKKVVQEVVDAAFAEIGDYFVKARMSRGTPRFTYPGFGTFTKRKRGARVGRNPQTGEHIDIPASMTVAFAPGQEMRGALNKK